MRRIASTARALSSAKILYRESLPNLPVLSSLFHSRPVSIYSRGFSVSASTTAPSLATEQSVAAAISSAKEAVKAEDPIANKMTKHAVNLAKSAFGQTHEMTLEALRLQFETEEDLMVAKSLMQQIIVVSKELYGSRDSRTLSSMATLGDLSHAIGELSEAETIYTSALKAQREVLGDVHPETIDTLRGLAMMYFTNDQHEQAEPLFVECLAGYRQLYGEDHDDTMSWMAYLGNLYGSLEKFDLAVPLLKECVQKYNTKFGEEHEESISRLVELATVYAELKDYPTALSLFEICLERQTRILGPQHEDTLDTAACIKAIQIDGFQSPKRLA